MRRVWPVMMLLAAALSGCAGSEVDVEPFDAVEAPTWNAGDVFAYNITGVVGGEATITVDGATVSQMNASQDIVDSQVLVYEILSTNFTSDEPVYMAIARFTENMQFGLLGESLQGLGKVPLAFRQSDLSPAVVELEQQQACDPGCRLATTGAIVHEPVLDHYLPFPLSPGQTWRNDIPIGGMLAEYGGFVNLHAHVLGMEVIEGPEGPVDAIRIEHALQLPFDDEFLQFMANQAGTGYEDIEIETNVDGKVITHYAPSLRNVVRETVQMDLGLELSFTDDGARHQIVGSAMTDLVTYLAAYTVGNGTSLDEQGLFDRYDSALGIADPFGGRDGYEVTVVPSRSDFNVADGGLVDFTITTTPALRESDTLRFSIVDGRGNALATGTGSDFSYDFDEAGLYYTLVQVTSPAGVVQGMGDAYVAADFAGSVELLCGTAIVSGVPGSGSCTEATIPVYNPVGLADAIISIDGSVVASRGAEFIIEDFKGTGASVPADSGKATISLSELGDLAINAQGWEALWVADYALEPSLTVDIVLDYAVPT